MKMDKIVEIRSESECKVLQISSEQKEPYLTVTIVPFRCHFATFLTSDEQMALLSFFCRLFFLDLLTVREVVFSSSEVYYLLLAENSNNNAIKVNIALRVSNSRSENNIISVWCESKVRRAAGVPFRVYCVCVWCVPNWVY